MTSPAFRLACTLLLACAVLGPRAAAQTPTTLFAETFDDATPPALPSDWPASGAGWKTDAPSASSDSPESGGPGLAHSGAQAGQLRTPAIDLSGVVSATLRYQARRSGTYPRARLSITASVGDDATFSTVVADTGAALPEQVNTYDLVEIALPPELLGQSGVVFRFEAMGGGSQAVFRIDDVMVTGVRPVRVEPAALSFFAQSGAQEEHTFTVTNQSGQALDLEAPQVVGAAFSVSPPGAVTLADGATQDYTVTFAPAADGRYDGTVSLAHAFGQSVVSLAGTTGGGRFGFETAASEALEETGEVDLPLSLDYANPVALLGLEFTVTWPDTLLSFVSVERGVAVAEAGAWNLSYEAGAGEVKVVLLGEDTGGLEAQVYAPLLRLRLASGTVAPQDARSVSLTLGNVIGALALPEGGDADVVLSTAGHTLAVARRRAFFVPAAPTVDVGTVAVGETGTARLAVANDGGTRALSITAVASDNALFTVEPATATVGPEGTREFTITFAPTPAAFGPQTGTLTFTHDGEEGPAFDVEVAGYGVGGRGDSDGDGLVDAMDLVEGLDFVLGRHEPTGPQRAAVDLFPFPGGDGALDVRDLTVLVQAIAGGAWPDAAHLPEESGGAGKTAADAEVVLRHVPHGAGQVVRVEHAQPLRALQLIYRFDNIEHAPEVVADAARPAGAALLVREDRARGEVRVVLYRPDGGVLPPGAYALCSLPAAWPPPVRYATAIDAGRQRLPVTVASGVSTAPEEEAPPPETFALGALYPNPFDPSAGHTLRLPVAVPAPTTVYVDLYDVLGRRVARLQQPVEGRAVLVWDGRSAGGGRVGPGVYVVRAYTAAGAQARSTVIVR